MLSSIRCPFAVAVCRGAPGTLNVSLSIVVRARQSGILLYTTLRGRRGESGATRDITGHQLPSPSQELLKRSSHRRNPGNRAFLRLMNTDYASTYPPFVIYQRRYSVLSFFLSLFLVQQLFCRLNYLPRFIYIYMYLRMKRKGEKGDECHR